MPPLAASAPLLLRPTLDRFKAPGQGRAFVYCPGRAPNDDASTRCVRRQGVHAVCSEAAAVECQHACDIVILSLGLQNALAAAGCLLLPGRVRGRVARRRLFLVFGLQEFIVVGVRVLGVSPFFYGVFGGVCVRGPLLFFSGGF